MMFSISSTSQMHEFGLVWPERIPSSGLNSPYALIPLLGCAVLRCVSTTPSMAEEMILMFPTYPAISHLRMLQR